MTLKTETTKEEAAHNDYIKNCEVLYEREERRKEGMEGGRNEVG